MGQVFSPLDEELGLLPEIHAKTASGPEPMGAKLPFREAVEEIAYGYGTQVGEATLRRVTYETGRAAEQLEQAVVNDLEAGIEVTEVNPAAQLVFSVDGSFIHLTNGEWREVKSVAMGEFGSHWSAKERRWQGQAVFELTDYRGQQGRKGETYLAWQLPNSYLGQHQHRPKGRQKRINRELKDLVMQGMPGNVEERD